MKLKKNIGEISINPEHRKNRDNILRRAFRQKFNQAPAYKGQQNDKKAIQAYLYEIQTWAKDNLDVAANGAIVDVVGHRIILNLPSNVEKLNPLYLDDTYKDLDDMYEDMSDAIAGKHVDAKYIWVAPEHVARYVLGEEWYERIVIPGR